MRWKLHFPIDIMTNIVSEQLVDSVLLKLVNADDPVLVQKVCKNSCWIKHIRLNCLL